MRSPEGSRWTRPGFQSHQSHQSHQSLSCWVTKPAPRAFGMELFVLPIEIPENFNTNTRKLHFPAPFPLLYICLPSTLEHFLTYCNVCVAWILLWGFQIFLWGFHMSFCYILHVGFGIYSWNTTYINYYLFIISFISCLSRIIYHLSFMAATCTAHGQQQLIKPRVIYVN